MAFLRNIWYAAMWAQDLAPSSMEARTFLNEPVVLIRHADASIDALADMCPHRFAPLHLGKLMEGNRIRCPYHGLSFDGAGRCVHNPHGDGRIPPTARVRAYPVVERHGMIWIWMGERAADPAMIPDFSLLDPPNEVSRREWLKMDANYTLIVDNLLDLSHTCFLHEGILGNEQTIRAEMSLTQTDNSMFVGRFARDVPVPGFFNHMFQRDGRNVDWWADMTWFAPGCLINDTGVTRPGTPRKAGTGIFGTHFLTPETETTTWYHFAGVRWNPIKWGEPIDTEVMEKIAAMRRHAFEFEDKLVIEGQQKAMSRHPELRPLVLNIDVGPVRCQTIMEKLLRAESDAIAAE